VVSVRDAVFEIGYSVAQGSSLRLFDVESQQAPALGRLVASRRAMWPTCAASSCRSSAETGLGPTSYMRVVGRLLSAVRRNIYIRHAIPISASIMRAPHRLRAARRLESGHSGASVTFSCASYASSTSPIGPSMRSRP
jgi:hypothetical protein